MVEDESSADTITFLVVKACQALEVDEGKSFELFFIVSARRGRLGVESGRTWRAGHHTHQRHE